MKTFALLILCAFHLTIASAQEVETVRAQATYTIKDIKENTNFVETWIFSMPKGGGTITVHKESGVDGVSEIHTMELGTRVIAFPELGTLFKEKTSKPVEFMEHGERGIGSVYMYDAPDKPAVSAWPLVYGVEIAKNGVRRATFKVFLSKGRMLTIVRDFIFGQYFAPLAERQTTTAVDGSIESDLIFLRQE